MIDTSYRTITVHIPEGRDTQFYVAEATVTPDQILGGDDTGVLCLCFQSEVADRITDLLNGSPPRLDG